MTLIKFPKIKFAIGDYINHEDKKVPTVQIYDEFENTLYNDTVDILSFNKNKDFSDPKMAAFVVLVMTLSTYYGHNMHNDVYTKDYNEFIENNSELISSISQMAEKFITDDSEEFGKYIK